MAAAALSTSSGAARSSRRAPRRAAPAHVAHGVLTDTSDDVPSSTDDARSDVQLTAGRTQQQGDQDAGGQQASSALLGAAAVDHDGAKIPWACRGAGVERLRSPSKRNGARQVYGLPGVGG